MPLVEDDHVVETLTSNGADHPFDKWILPRGARCGKDLLYPETVDASIEVRSVGLVSVPYQVPRRRVPWKSIDHLLRRPLGRRMFGDIEMNDTATVVAKDDEDEQNSEGCGRQSEKVERHQVVCMGLSRKEMPLRQVPMGRWHACDGEPPQRYTLETAVLGNRRCLASPARDIARGELVRSSSKYSCGVPMVET